MYKFNSNEPIYLQLIDIIKQRIVNGSLNESTKVKSVRDYAVEFGVNPNTVQKALSELERAGFIYTERTSGRYVALTESKAQAARLELAEAKTIAYLQWMLDLGCQPEEIHNLIKNKLKEKRRQK